MMAHTTGTSDDKNDKTMDTNEKKLDSDSGQRTVTADKPNLQEAARPQSAAEIWTEQRTKHLHAATVTRAKHCASLRTLRGTSSRWNNTLC